MLADPSGAKTLVITCQYLARCPVHDDVIEWGDSGPATGHV